MPSSSGLVVSEVKGVTVVGFQTASIMDLPAIEMIGGELYALVDQQARRKIVLDFSAVRFLSSQMLGVIILLQKKARLIGGRVVLCAMRPELMKVFQITKLDKILEFAPDERGALAKLDVLGMA
jgi:anti-sigma B factor antagonist